jgi:hydroxymethylglutaryl-CoA reductase
VSSQSPIPNPQSLKLRDIPVDQRAAALNLGDADIAALRNGLSLDQANHMIENVVATYALPLGIAQNFVVNGREVLVPMVVEESSVVAACSYAAKLARATGGFVAGSSEPIMIGQIQVLDVPDMDGAIQRITEAKDELIHWLNTQNPSTQSKHARAVGMEIRDWRLEIKKTSQSLISNLQSLSSMLVVHLLYHCGDAMGANLINTACEALAPKIEQLSGGRVNLRILSNLSDKRLAWAKCVIPVSSLDLGPSAISNLQSPIYLRIVEASLFAELDLYRAATHNKGVMNGVDAVVLATGNDWRAVEAAAHAYAARDGRYTSLTTWRTNEAGDLVGEIKLPMAVGIVGGATRVHPSAQVALKILGVQTARELAEIIACVGLAQNFAAIRALASEGIQQGHMGLHARQIAVAAGATGDDVDRIAAQLVQEKNVRLERAKQLLDLLQK